MSLKCTKLWFNLRPYGDTKTGLDTIYDKFEVGKDGVVKIRNMTPICDNPPPDSYDIVFEDGSVQTIYNPNRAFYIEENK